MHLLVLHLFFWWIISCLNKGNPKSKKFWSKSLESTLKENNSKQTNFIHYFCLYSKKKKICLVNNLYFLDSFSRRTNTLQKKLTKPDKWVFFFLNTYEKNCKEKQLMFHVGLRSTLNQFDFYASNSCLSFFFFFGILLIYYVVLSQFYLQHPRVNWVWKTALKQKNGTCKVCL